MCKMLERHIAVHWSGKSHLHFQNTDIIAVAKKEFKYKPGNPFYIMKHFMKPLQCWSHQSQHYSFNTCYVIICLVFSGAIFNYGQYITGITIIVLTLNCILSYDARQNTVWQTVPVLLQFVTSQGKGLIWCGKRLLPLPPTIHCELNSAPFPTTHLA